MKCNGCRSFPALACVALILNSTVARAEAPPPKPVPPAMEINSTTNADSSVKNAGKNKVIVTGSNIPKPVQRIGRTTDSVSPVLIIDQQDIQRSGATTVGQVLRRLPFATTGPGR